MATTKQVQAHFWVSCGTIYLLNMVDERGLVSRERVLCGLHHGATSDRVRRYTCTPRIERWLRAGLAAVSAHEGLIAVHSSG